MKPSDDPRVCESAGVAMEATTFCSCVIIYEPSSWHAEAFVGRSLADMSPLPQVSPGKQAARLEHHVCCVFAAHVGSRVFIRACFAQPQLSYAPFCRDGRWQWLSIAVVAWPCWHQHHCGRHLGTLPARGGHCIPSAFRRQQQWRQPFPALAATAATVGEETRRQSITARWASRPSAAMRAQVQPWVGHGAPALRHTAGLTACK